MFNKKYQARPRSSCEAAGYDDDDVHDDDGAGGSGDSDSDEGRNVGGDGWWSSYQ